MIGTQLQLAGRAKLHPLVLPAYRRQTMVMSTGLVRASSAANPTGREEGTQQSSDGDGSAGSNAAENAEFSVVSETVLHRRYLTLYNRSVQFPSSDGTTPVRGDNRRSPLSQYAVHCAVPVRSARGPAQPWNHPLLCVSLFRARCTSMM